MNSFVSLFRRYSLLQIGEFAVSEIRQRIWNRYIFNSYSQHGEDIILDDLLHNKKNGFYIDVGAYDPYRFSNTMRFYKRGWKGINIEPNTVNWKLFEMYREKDVNLNIGIGKKEGVLTFYTMDPPTLSTFSQDQAIEYQKKGFQIVSKTKVQIIPLRNVIKKYSKGRKIDFLSVDVEGFEMEVLKSNDWKTNRPSIICIETANPNTEGSEQLDTIRSFLEKQGYAFIMNHKDNAFYKDSKPEHKKN
jgi:FkbM family methyltransferase